MGWLPVALAIVAAILVYGTGQTMLLVASIVAAIGNLWSWGIMHNYAVERAKHRANYSGGFYDFTKAEAESVPNWITWINMGFSLLSLIALIVAVVLRII